MSVKYVEPVEMGDLFKDFAEYLSMADILAAKTLAKISATICKKRIDMGMTQKEFADFMEVSQGMVSKWESEDYNFSIETLAKICDKLDLQLEIEMKSNINQFKDNFIAKRLINSRKENKWDLTLPNYFGKNTYNEAV